MMSPHVEAGTLGLHHLGELTPAQTDAVHRHLLACASCRERAEVVIDAVTALAFLEKGDVDTTPDPEPPARPATTRRPVGTRPGGATRPGVSRTRGKRKRLVRLGSLLVLLLVFAGLGIGAIVRGTGESRVEVATASATARDNRSGASLSVFLTGLENGGTRVRASVSGLHEGDEYVLNAVTADAESHPVARWPGRPGVEEATGELAGVPVDRLSSFNVTRGPSVVVVSVYLTSTAAPNTKGD